MTIKIEIECDARGCLDSTELRDITDADIRDVFYHTHPIDGIQHYCSRCWPKAKKEIETDD